MIPMISQYSACIHRISDKQLNVKIFGLIIGVTRPEGESCFKFKENVFQRLTLPEKFCRNRKPYNLVKLLTC